MPWPFRRKADQPQQTKSASYFFTLGQGRAGLTGAGYDKLATEGYGECLVAFACINKIASAVASIDLQLYEKAKGGKITKVEDSDLLELLEHPNPAQSGREFMQYLVSYYLLASNAYVFGNGIDPKRNNGKPPSELQILNPGKVKVEPGPSLFPSRYEYRPTPDQFQTFEVDQLSGRSAILQLKSFHPLNAWTGLPALAPAARSVDIHTSGQAWNMSLIKNGARPSGAMVVKGKDGQAEFLGDEQYTRLKQQIDEKFSGTANAGKPILLEGGLEWQEMSLNPKDMEFLEGKNSAARDIALAFGVPPQLLGIPGDSTFSNFAEAKLAFQTDTVLPLLGWILDGFNRWLVPYYSDSMFLWYDEEMIPALEPLRKQKADRINSASYLTVNEKRTAMGLDSLADAGDVVLVPSSMVPLELAGSMDLAESGSPDEKDPPQDD